MNDISLAVYSNFDAIQRAAAVLYRSKLFGQIDEMQAIAKVLAGAELGLPPFASMAGIHIVQGKPVLGANLIATLIKNSNRYDYKVKEATDKVCTLEWYEYGKVVGESSFTIEEAQEAGLTNRENWKKYPSDMLFARAVSRGARRFAPGVFGGSPVYTPDEAEGFAGPSGAIEDVDVVDVPEEEHNEEPEQNADDSNGGEANATGDKPARPYSPEVLKEKLVFSAGRLPPADADTVDEVYLSLLKSVGEDGVEKVIAWLGGTGDKLETVGFSVVSAMAKWLKPENALITDKYASDELEALIAYIDSKK